MRRSGLLKFVVGLVALFVAIYFAAEAFGVRINATASLPQGLYRITDDPRAPLVEFCPSGPFSALSVARGYRLPGLCPDGGSPLLKPVAAEEGDIVTLSSSGLWVNGRHLPNTAPEGRDTRGRPLSAWPFGTYKVPPGVIWVASTYNSHSYDSRYFGPIPAQSVRHRMIPLCTVSFRGFFREGVLMRRFSDLAAWAIFLSAPVSVSTMGGLLLKYILVCCFTAAFHAPPPPISETDCALMILFGIIIVIDFPFFAVKPVREWLWRQLSGGDSCKDV